MWVLVLRLRVCALCEEALASGYPTSGCPGSLAVGAAGRSSQLEPLWPPNLIASRCLGRVVSLTAARGRHLTGRLSSRRSCDRLTRKRKHSWGALPGALPVLSRGCCVGWSRAGKAMSDSEDYSSGEDEDYLPSGEDYSEDDVNELVEEEQTEKQSCRGKREKNSTAVRDRKRSKGGGLCLESDDETSKDGASDSKEDDLGENCPEVKEEEKKKKEDALWASFLSDVGPSPRAAATDQVTCTEKGKVCSKMEMVAKVPQVAEKNTCKSQEAAKESKKPKVAITKVFDFAGEEVRITQEVDASSREAQLFLKKQEQEADSPASDPTGSGVKRPSGISNLLGKLGAKKQKLSTLEKSKLDWEHFKEEEGIGEELAIHNRGKEGYLERKAFLERVDHRQFEIERDIRLSSMKP